MTLTDSHTHLYLEQFDQDREEMLQRANEAGVQRFFLPNIDQSSVPAMMELARNHPEQCFPMMGVHPCSICANYKEELDHARKWLEKEKFCAIGEIGIDLYWDKTYLKEQQEAFRTQIRWAKELSLPIVIHARESFDEIFAIVDEENDDRLTGVFHCFTGTLDQAKHILNYGGFFLGIGGVVTFKKSGLDQVVKELDPGSLVLETDSPYLAPTPYRGKRNESAYVSIVAQKVADLHQRPVEEIADITTQNTKTLFGI